ncbi:MAG: hypothetical protein A2231_05380 [Candidatus Firestonebacteria bacterium RIFOXYA2_FULL_40_8]|nr:MAG: hypothetical protein A2231_05380 [Candidatus Firestonebacteria bacterium RIFOXYA2_FULL_40_8]
MKQNMKICRLYLQLLLRRKIIAIFRIIYLKSGLDITESIIYTYLSIPTAPLLKSMRNSVGFCFLRGEINGI